MYIHLGCNTLVKSEEIIGIFDLDNTTVSSRTRDFLRKAEKSGQIVLAGNELPKSFVLTNKNKKTRVFLSQFATSTLCKRKNRTEL